MHDSIVADAGGLLVLAGVLEGALHRTDEILALDATSLLVAEYLALRHVGAPDRARNEFVVVIGIVREWFAVRSLALAAALAAGPGGETDAQVALELAESLRVPLVTKNVELASDEVDVLRC